MDAPGYLGRKGTALTVIGGAITATWLIVVAFYVSDEIGWGNVGMMLPHELGFSLSGVFAPLAFLWLILLYAGANRGLDEATYALHRRLDQLTYPDDDAAERVAAVTRSLREQTRELSGASEMAAAEAERLRDRVGEQVQSLVGIAERMSSERMTLESSVQERATALTNAADRAQAASRAVAEALTTGLSALSNESGQAVAR